MLTPRICLMAAAIALVAAPMLSAASSVPTEPEQFMLELLNRARANPTAEAMRLGIALNEGIAPGTISTTPKQPLVWDGTIIQTAQLYAQVLLDNDAFTHTFGGTTFDMRMLAQGYSAQPRAENLAVGSTVASPTLAQIAARVEDLHELLFIDAGFPGRGHRINMMLDDVNELGVGARTDPAYQPGGFPMPLPSVLAVQDFGRRDATDYITGVVYIDGDMSGLYSVGEGWSGVTITATRTSDMMAFVTMTLGTGGYAVSVPPGTYDVVASGGGMAGIVTQPGIVVSGSNVKVDFDPSTAVFPCGSATCADCNQDGTRNILDALAAAQHATGLITLVGARFTNCNVQGAVEPSPSASVDILDALSIAQFAAGLPVTLSCC